MKNSTSEIVDRYFEAWRKGDFAGLRPHLADDFTFDGPLMNCAGPDEYVTRTMESAKQFAGAQYEIVSRVVDGDQAVVFSTLTMGPIVLHTAEHFRVDGDKIASARLYFDPTPLRR